MFSVCIHVRPARLVEKAAAPSGPMLFELQQSESEGAKGKRKERARGFLFVVRTATQRERGGRREEKRAGQGVLVMESRVLRHGGSAAPDVQRLHPRQASQTGGEGGGSVGANVIRTAKERERGGRREEERARQGFLLCNYNHYIIILGGGKAMDSEEEEEREREQEGCR
jgi:hypothetical protein